MQIYWTLKSIPELSGLPLGERMRVWRAAHWNIYRHWQFWASLVGMVLCMGIGRHIYDRIGGYIGVVVGSFIFSQVSAHLARPYIRAYLSDERVEEQRHRPISGQELLTAALVVPVLVVLILLVSYALRGFPAPVFPAPVLDRELVRLF